MTTNEQQTEVGVQESEAESVVHTAVPGTQSELPFALIQGEPLTELPQDLYIPPDALRVFLEAFEGPLDLLLYLIKRQNIDILNIPVLEITKQYTQYIDLMHDMELELAGEYLLMAAMLAEIKSRMLLPRPVSAEAEEDDPRAELVRRLLEYERFKKAASDIDALPRMERDVFQVAAEVDAPEQAPPLPDVTLKELVISFQEVLRRAQMYAHHQIQREALSVRERMTQVLSKLEQNEFQEFTSLFNAKEGRAGVVVTFLAILELIKDGLLELVQSEPFAPIHVKAAGGVSTRPNLTVVENTPENNID